MVGLGTLINMAAIAAGRHRGARFQAVSQQIAADKPDERDGSCLHVPRHRGNALSHAPRFRHRTRADIDRRDDDGDFFYGRNADRHHPEA